MSNPVPMLFRLLSALLLIAAPSAMKGADSFYPKQLHTPAAESDSLSATGQSSVGDDTFQPVNPDGSTSIEPWINVNDGLDTEYKRYPLPPDATSSRDFPVCGVPVSVDTTPLGAATFSIQIEVPPGVASMTPQLSIAYSSMQGDGPLGLGCYIQGLSGINRSAKDIWHDGKATGVAYDESDALRLDGRRLMIKIGAAAADGKVFTIEDSPFTTIIQHGTGTDSWFEARTPDGRTMTYGADDNSRQTVTAPSGKTFVASWLISSCEDANGNFIEYRYLHDGLCLYPYIISYGGNRHTTSGAKNEIVFGYGDRPDASSFVIGDAAGRMSKILSSIVTKTGDAVYRKTRLRYSQDQGSGRSLLNGVCIGLSDKKWQKEIVVSWNETHGFQPSPKEIYGDTSLLLTEKKGQKLLAADFNGDGVTDIVEFAEAEINLGGGTKKLTNLCIPYLSSVKADGTVAHSMSQPIELGKDFSFSNWKQKSGYPLLADMNGDGTSDLLMVSEHDKTGRFVTRKYTDPETTRFSYAYDTFGRLLKETDETDPANPLATTHGYNSWGQETRITSPEGACLKTWYGWSSDAARRYYRLTYCLGQPWTKTWYDACGRETRTETVGDGGLLLTTDTEYDSRGNAVRSTTTRGRLTESAVRTYDSRGRLTAETASSGKRTDYVYGRRSVSVSDGVKTVTREYDSQGNIRKAADPMTTVEYRYASNGKPKKVACAGGTLRMEYDEAGNRTMLDDPDAGTERSAFDAEGKLTSRTDDRGNTRTYSYDEYGRLQRATGADSDITYTYDRQGRISMTEHDGSAIGYTYDKYGRTITECRSFADGDMQVHTYEYDKFGNVVKETWPDGVSASYAFDEYGNNTACVMGTDTVWAAKSDDGLVSEESVLGGAFTKVRRLDNFGFLSELRLERGERKKFRRKRYVYDPKTGSMTYRDGMRGSGSDSFKYDSMDRLVSYTKSLFELADSTSGAAWQVSFPGSIAGGIAPGIGEGAAQSSNTDSYAYSPDGNITSFPVAGRYSYMSDRPHAVAEVSNPDGKMNAAEQHISYNAISKASAIHESKADGEYELDMRYGPDGERWASVMTKDGEDILAVHYGNGYESQERGDTLREYTYLGNGLLHYSENGSGRLLYMFTDCQGSVTDIYSEDGDCLFHAEYDPWGNMTAQKNEIAFRRGYTGHEMLPEFGLVNMNGRMYDPRVGRFLSPDPYVQMPDNGQNFNRYSYCLNNPLKYTDPSGRIAGSEIGAHLFGEALAYGASAAAGTYSEGLLSGPAFVLGKLVGGYAGGILGGDFGGAISGAVFDYFYY